MQHDSAAVVTYKAMCELVPDLIVQVRDLKPMLLLVALLTDRAQRALLRAREDRDRAFYTETVLMGITILRVGQQDAGALRRELESWLTGNDDQ